MAYLEQSTRYVPYTDRPNGRWKYHVPCELDGTPDSATASSRTHGPRLRDLRAMDPGGGGHFRRRYPKTSETTPTRVYRVGDPRQGARHARGLLPAATTSNVGLYGTGQALRGAAAPDVCAPAGRSARPCGGDARRTARGHPGVSRARRPAGSRRPLDRLPARRLARAFETAAAHATGCSRHRSEARDEVTLTEFDPDGETQGGGVGAVQRVGATRRPDRWRSRRALLSGRSRRRCCAPTPARAPTGGTNRDAPSSGRATAST